MDQMGYKNVPRGNRNKWCYEMLGQIRETVTVHFPEFKGLHGVEPAKVVTYKVDEQKVDMPHSVISVLTLASNLELWAERGYKMTTSGRAQN